ncbi:ABC transporter permease [Actomonas aquatica]|uniref:ABC transporter permease n=1 Tax=Actomonas aquatica TaxID=2866162 RepID=A0ABZ1CCN7_9BACT|nr:ABC transporter permease [Opitutus sp. WL0086]WRQ88374.1 ABC transporter permease [Opitutus sp. WL0086]
MNDLRFALRSLSKTPGFTLIAVLTLALAIGANTAIFAIVNDLLLKPLVPAGDRPVVNVFHGEGDAGRAYRGFSWQELQELRQENPVFEDAAAVDFVLAGVGDGNNVRRTFAFFGTENLLNLIDQTPVRGRFFEAAESLPGANIPVVFASHSLWQRLGAKEDFVGSELRINGHPYTVIGVGARDLSLGHALITPEIWLPFGMHDTFRGNLIQNTEADAAVALDNPRRHSLNVMARLRPGLGLAGATAQLPVLDQRLDAIDTDPGEAPRRLEIEAPSRINISSVPSGDQGVGIFGALLLGMAGVVLLIACLNLANMLLARGAARTREFAVRLALGASRGRIIRQLLAEGLVLSLVGGAAGVLLALWANDLLINSISGLFSSMNFAVLVEAEPDPAVLLATLGFCAIATILSGLGPALKSSRVGLVEDLKYQGAESTATGSWNRFFSARHLLVMGQISLSLALIFAAGLFLRGALNAGGLDLGFEKDHGLLVELDYALTDTPAPLARERLLALHDEAASRPGLTAALSTQAPYSNTTADDRYKVAGSAEVDADGEPTGVSAIFNAITGDYFDAIGVPLLRGRKFTDAEVHSADAPPVAIIDERMAQRLFPEGDALGQRISRTQGPASGEPPVEYEIVGICGSFRHDVFSPDGPRRVFFPFARESVPNTFLHLRDARAGRDAAVALLPTARALISAVDANAPVIDAIPLADFVERNIGLWIVRVGAVLFGVFGGVALLLAVIGVYGVKAYAVTRRTREIGIRMALGARPGDVFALIMRQGTAQTALSIVVGAFLSLAIGQLLSQMLFRVDPLDPLVLGSAALVLAVATLTACFLPARRAAKVEPMRAIRTE